ncbi:MAG: hypothetical protein E7282_09625 [Lachnospiraceae bacterium]|nr:hypothetical protein [Lachnospiraceae bacterium]
MRDYNIAYSYEGISMWEDETWKDRENAAAPIFHALEIVLKNQPVQEYYPDRTDEVRDRLNHSCYFRDIVDKWKAQGMRFCDYGMMGIQMVPNDIYEHKMENPKILMIPYIASENPHEAMNLIYENRELIKNAAKECVLVQFVDCRMATGGAMVEKIVELQGTYRIRCEQIYVDVTKLSHPENLFIPVQLDVICGRKAINISGKLASYSAHQYDISKIYRRVIPEWDFDRHIRSLAGKRQAESMKLEHDYKGPHDPGMKAFFAQRGICYEDHEFEREWYVTLMPENIMLPNAKKLPLLIVMKEPRTACEFAMQTAFQFYYDFIEICARGEFAMLFFALETPKDNCEVLSKLIEKVLYEHPELDANRVYLTGQSHNGYYAQEFYRANPKLIAACAALCDPVGLEYGARADYYLQDAEELIESFRKYDFPLIDINGNLENHYSHDGRTNQEHQEDIQCFMNRMKAIRHTEYTVEQIEAAKSDVDYATRMNGVPSDRTEVRFMMGSEVYISDYCNEDGKWYFRYASIENTPHMIMPQMAELSWEFMRKFARDNQSGKVIELY